MRLLALALTFCLLSLPLSAQTMIIAEDPAWVDIVAIPEGPADLRAEVEGGQFFLLSDHQMHWEGDVKQSYSRVVAEVTDRAGLEDLATIRVDFDPAFDTVSLTRLLVHRDGQVIDLKAVVDPQIYRRETRLEEGIIDGTLTAVIQVPDLRVGDLLEQATLLQTASPFGTVDRTGSSWLEWSTPVVLSRVLLTWPTDDPLELGSLPDRVTHSATDLGDGTTRHEWRRENHIPPLEEKGVPYETVEDARLQFSATRDWTPFVKQIAPHYTRDYPLPQAWEAKVDKIAATETSEGGRAYAALRLVQDDLRYVSISVGAGGYFARTPEEVIASGFGDCKDKSLLLRVILDRLGVKAAVALTDLDAGYGLSGELPTPWVFDHMILRATLDGKPVWMDPTGSHEGGGIGTAAQPDYGYALPLVDGPAGLERMEVTAKGTWAQEVHEDYRFSALGVFLTVTTLNLTGAADEARARWATTPASQIGRNFLDFYLNRYPGLTAPKPPRMTDDRKANRVTVVESYFLPFTALDQNGLREDFAFAALGFTDRFPDPQSRERRMPMAVGGPWSVDHRVTVRGAPIDFTPPEAVVISNPAFDFGYHGLASAGGEMELIWSYAPKVHSIPAPDVQAVLDDVQSVEDLTWYSWDLTPD